MNEAETLQISLLRPPREDENDKRKVGIARMFARSVPLATHFRPERCGESVTFTIEFPTMDTKWKPVRSEPRAYLPPFISLFSFQHFANSWKENLSRIESWLESGSLALDPDGKDGTKEKFRGRNGEQGS